LQAVPQEKVLEVRSIDHVETRYPAVPRVRAALAYERSLKRVLDVVLAALGLVASAPIWLAVVIAIKLDSPGPALFVQERVGLHGRRFRFYKFRSMHVDAESRLHDVREKNEVDGPVFKMRRDPRVTRVGALLRRTSLDELPQLVNVLTGDMSMVGPRPPLPREVEKYRPSDLVRLSVKPGLTCLWQIRGRSTVGFDTWMEYDREYVRRLSAWLDVTILVRTVWAVLSCRGAY
jgi:exopolysaccharide biosynthesis polyprenyl glycosylphosphotransferase